MSLQIQCDGCHKSYRAGLPDEHGILCPFCGHEAVPPKRRTATAPARARFKPNWQLLTAVGGLSAGLIATVAMGLSVPGESKSVWSEDLPVPLVKLSGEPENPSAQVQVASLPAAVEVEDVIAFPLPPEQVQVVIPAVAEKLHEVKAKLDAAEPAERPAQAPLRIKRRHERSDEELRKELLMITELKLDNIPRSALVALQNAPKNRKYRDDERPDFAGLPMRMGVDCQLGKEPAEQLQHLSRKLREAIAAAMQGTVVVDVAKLRGVLLNGVEIQRGRLGIAGRGNVAANQGNPKLEGNMWLRPEAVPTLNQMLMPEGKDVRLLLVEVLSLIPGRCATEALVQRSLYDLSKDVRAAAIEALNNRPREEYRAMILDGFRYPWAAAADHASEALVALKDTEAVPTLVNMLDEPSPQAPFVRKNDKQLVTRELVRVNHLGNCTMCHARSAGTVDPVRGRVPSDKLPLPPLVQYYDSADGIFVRADVTYLKQDFSVPQPVERHGPWPANQRFDYLVRTRPLNQAELQVLRLKKAEQDLARAQLGNDAFTVKEPRYEQRSAVLFALRELTGRDVGDTTRAWRKLYALR